MHDSGIHLVVGVVAVFGAHEDVEVREVFFDHLDHLHSFFAVSYGNDNDLGSSGSGNLKEVVAGGVSIVDFKA
ncbi:hypothetical protein D3C86_1420010 [compost metagenome]